MNFFSTLHGNLYFLDWFIIISAIVVLRVFSYSTKKYMRSVADFLSANRLAGRYLLTISSAMGSIGVVSIVAGFEAVNESGMSPSWWGYMSLPVFIIITLVGWVYCRFRETRALTLAQFFENRYSKKFRIFAGICCWVSGVLNFGIFPAVAARFLIYYCGLPERFHLLPGCDWTLSTFLTVMAVDIFLALSFVNLGGQISVMITDCAQGIFSAIAFLIVGMFLYFKFGYTGYIRALQSGSQPGQNMLNPFECSKVQNFNVWYYLIGIFSTFYNYHAWQGSQGFFSSAKTPHEYKMGTIIGGWRQIPQVLCILLMSLATVAIFRLPEYASLAEHINAQRDSVTNAVVKGQLQLPLAMAAILPMGLKGLLCTIMVFISFTCHDTYMHSWGSIFVQDVYMPIAGKKFRPHEHINILRYSITFVGIFAFVFSALYPQNQPILMFFAITGAIWGGGAGSVIVGGLYTKKGNTAGAFAALITGAFVGLIGVFIKPIWECFLRLSQNVLPDFYAKYTFAADGAVQYKDFPLNGQYINLITMLCSIFMYILFSFLFYKKWGDFNLDRLLHRGDYALAEENVSVNEKISKLELVCGITKQFNKYDKLWTYLMLAYNLVIFLWFAGFSIYNLYVKYALHSIVPDQIWGIAHFWIIWMNLILCIPVTVWFTCGGIRDMKQLYRDLSTARRDDRDNGQN